MNCSYLEDLAKTTKIVNNAIFNMHYQTEIKTSAYLWVIAVIACKYYNVDFVLFREKSRKGNVVLARKAYIFFAFEYKNWICLSRWNLDTIGSICNITKSTVHHHLNKTTLELEVDKTMRQDYSIINNYIKEHLEL